MRLSAASHGDRHTLLWVDDAALSAQENRLLADLDLSVNNTFKEKSIGHLGVTVKSLAEDWPTIQDCLMLYDQILRPVPFNSSRIIHPETRFESAFVQYPAVTVVPSRLRLSKQFALTWPQVTDSQASSDLLLHACYGIHANSVMIACIDSRAQVWSTEIRRAEDDAPNLVRQVWEAVLAFAARTSEQCTVAICRLSAFDALELAGELGKAFIATNVEAYIISIGPIAWQSALSGAHKTPWLRRVLLTCIDTRSGLSVPMRMSHPTEVVRASGAGSAKMSFQDVSNLRHALLFDEKSMIHPFSSFDPVQTAVIISQASGATRPALQPPTVSTLHLVSAVTNLQGFPLQECRDWFLHLLQSFDELTAITKLRLSADLAFPWHVAAVLLMTDQDVA